MKQIVLTQGKFALVDDEDFEWLNQWKWHARKSWNMIYAGRQLPLINRKRALTHMHHEVIGRPPKGLMVDHRDGNGLNNQCRNLRFVTHRQNQQNQIHRNKSSQFPGIGWCKARKKWEARIVIKGKCKRLGYFINELEAFNVYRQTVEAIGEKVIL